MACEIDQFCLKRSCREMAKVIKELEDEYENLKQLYDEVVDIKDSIIDTDTKIQAIGRVEQFDEDYFKKEFGYLGYFDSTKEPYSSSSGLLPY